MRTLISILLAAALLAGCATAEGGPTADHRVVVLDRGATFRLLRVENGKVETLADLGPCEGCGAPVAAPDGRTLYIVTAVKTGQDPMLDSKVVTVDASTGAVSEGPAFAHGPLPWSWATTSASPDGRYLYLDIPHNPASAQYNPLHAQRGFVAYDLRTQKLLDHPFVSLSLDEGGGWEMHLAKDGKLGFLCCWVQGSDHPHPGIITVDLSSGKVVARTMINSPSHLVHPTRLTPAGDGRHFYALRAGSNAWWEIDAQAGKITRQGPEPPAEAPAPTNAPGWYDIALGELVTAKDLLFSSLYLAETDKMNPTTPKHKAGGGIRLLDIKDFSQTAHLLPDRTFEALALSPDGSTLYALDRESAELLAFDTKTFTQVSSTKTVGERPDRVLTLRK